MLLTFAGWQEFTITLVQLHIDTVRQLLQHHFCSKMCTVAAVDALLVLRRKIDLHNSACRILNSPWRQDLRRQTYPHLEMKHNPSWQTLGVSYTWHRKHAIVNVEVCFSLARDLLSVIDGLAIKQHLLSLLAEIVARV